MKSKNNQLRPISVISGYNKLQHLMPIIIVKKCKSIIMEISKNNLGTSQSMLQSVEKDATFMRNSHPEYARVISFILNAKAMQRRQEGNLDEAFRLLDEASLVQKKGCVSSADIARTILNKSVMMSQLARKQDKKNLFMQMDAFKLAGEALQLIDEKFKKKIGGKEELLFGELLIITFHNIATEFQHIKNILQAQILFKKAFNLSLRILGSKHMLTSHLKDIVGGYQKKKQRHFKSLKKIKRIQTQSSIAQNTSHYKLIQSNSRSSFKKNIIIESKQKSKIRISSSMSRRNPFLETGMNKTQKTMSRSLLKIPNQDKYIENIQLTESKYLPEPFNKNTSQIQQSLIKKSLQMQKEDKNCQLI